MKGRRPLMTESEWLACNEPRALLEAGGYPGGPRKVGPGAATFCRCSAPRLPNEGNRQAVLALADFLEGGMVIGQLITAARAVLGEEAVTPELAQWSLTMMETAPVRALELLMEMLIEGPPG